MKWTSVLLVIILLIGAYSFSITLAGPIEPLGRLGFVKFANPDMYPGHPHSELLAQYAEKRGSKCILVCHFAGSSDYSSYMEGDVYIMELAFIDTQGTGAADNVNYLDSLKIALFGVPDGRYKFKTDGRVFRSYDKAMDYIYRKAKRHDQEGRIPMVWHGTSRSENPIINQGCGFPLYFYIMSKEYGAIPAYIYTLAGILFPYFEDPYRNFELLHSSQLQELYTSGELDYY